MINEDDGHIGLCCLFGGELHMPRMQRQVQVQDGHVHEVAFDF